MNKEYEEKREALLKLKCVGDELKCVYDNVSGGTKKCPRNVIDIKQIKDIVKTRHGLAFDVGNGIRHNFDMIHEYNGELYYSWLCHSSETIIPIISKIIESEDTEWKKRY